MCPSHPPSSTTNPRIARERRPNRIAPRTKSPAARARRARLVAIALFVCAVALPLPALAEDCRLVEEEIHGPGAVFESVEAAVLDALRYAHREASPTDRQRLGVGVIYRVADGYSYGAVKRSAALSPLQPHRVRYRLRAIDVARYVIPPRSRQPHINRANEQPSRDEKRIVDEVDPRHRPLYQLTPSLNIVRYDGEGRTTLVSRLDDRDDLDERDDLDGRDAPHAAPMASRGARPRAEQDALCTTRSTTFLAHSAPAGLAD